MHQFKSCYLYQTYSWHPPITPILPSCPLWALSTSPGIVPRTNSRQLHCFFAGGLPNVASVDDLKRLSACCSPPAKVLRLIAITGRKLVTFTPIKYLFTTWKGMVPTDPPIKTSMCKAFSWNNILIAWDLGTTKYETASPLDRFFKHVFKMAALIRGPVVWF